MRVLLLVCWSFVMFCFLFTSDITALLGHGDLDIHLTPHPKFAFFDIYTFRFDVVLQKIGHLVLFGIWLLTIFLAIGRLKIAVWIMLGLAFASELLQPYFTRDGHLLDVAFDSVGILLMAFLIHVLSEVASSSSNGS